MALFNVFMYTTSTCCFSEVASSASGDTNDVRCVTMQSGVAWCYEVEAVVRCDMVKALSVAVRRGV